MTFDVAKKYDKDVFTKFLRDFLPDDFELEEEKLYFDSKILDSENSLSLGTSESLDLAVYEFCQRSKKDSRVSVTKETVSLMKKNCPKNNVLAVFYNKDSNRWRFSLITSDVVISDKGSLKQKFSNPKRFSFLLGEGCKRHTPESMFFENGGAESGRVKKVSDLEDLKSRFSVETVTKEFYNNLFAWYEWARTYVKYPRGVDKKVELVDYHQDEKAISTHIIRLITRLIFVWFIKQKDLVPKELFDEDDLAKILNNFGGEKRNSLKDGMYYNAILQNLFFATLNNQIEERGFAEQGEDYTRHFGIKTLFRDSKKGTYFSISHEEFKVLFSKIPYLNGGLFECLDHFDEADENHNRQIYVDGFSAEDGRKAFVPNALFFDEEKGIIPLLNRYNFTVEESTPSDIQVALDPELLGKVFENLLGAYNPETSKNARNDSGSFYTPREIVEYMVNESLKAYLLGKNVVSEEVVNVLFSEGEENSFDDEQGKNIADALKEVRVLDPACGSGAFPMGILNRLVELLLKIKPAQDIYRLKLDLIQNCIYGIDIQSIAVQISKLRFFISLICEQEKTDNADENYGINTLPNLETKIVCANSLIGVKRNRENHGLFHNAEIDRFESELLEIRNKHIIAKSVKEKFDLRKKDREISKRLVELLKSENKFGESNDSAEMLAKWNPYDQNAQSPFFDAEWMFGIKTSQAEGEEGNVASKRSSDCNAAPCGGFDIVIGNPPYVGEGENSSAFNEFKETSPYYIGKMNLWYGFACNGIDWLKENGILCFIATNNWTTTAGGKKLRNKIMNDARIIQLIDFNSYMIFESANIQTMIMIFKKNRKTDNYAFDFRKLTKPMAKKDDMISMLDRTLEQADYLEPKVSRQKFINKHFVFSVGLKDLILEKMTENAEYLNDDDATNGIHPHYDFVNNKINRLHPFTTVGAGIFGLSEKEKNDLTLSNSELKLIKPYFTTEQIHRFYTEPKNALWIIYTTSDFKNPNSMNKYPHLKKHLDYYKDVISSCNKPYGLHRSREEKFFTGEKIVVLRKCVGKPSFSYSDFDCYVSATFYVIKTSRFNLKFLTGLLNSNAVAFWLKNRGKMQGENFQVDKEPLMGIPIPQATKEQQKEIVLLVDKILATKKADLLADTTELERQIDILVYKLYGLCEEEIIMIEEK